jgi:hypothetical protein
MTFPSMEEWQDLAEADGPVAVPALPAGEPADGDELQELISI